MGQQTSKYLFMYECRKMLSHFKFFNRFAIWVSWLSFNLLQQTEELRKREISFMSSSKGFSMGTILG